MSAAKVLRIRDMILQRGWQLTELYNGDQRCYLTRISGPIVDVGGEVRIWNLQKFLPVEEIQRSAITSYDIWGQHFQKLIRDAEQYLTDVHAKVAAGEYIVVDKPVAVVSPE